MDPTFEKWDHKAVSVAMNKLQATGSGRARKSTN